MNQINIFYNLKSYNRQASSFLTTIGASLNINPKFGKN